MFAGKFAGVVLLLSISLGAQEPPAPPQARISGLVRTTQGSPIPGATVRLVELSTGRAWVSWTAENGKFELAGLPPGRYGIEAEQIGFQAGSKQVELASASAAQTPNETAPPALELTLTVAPLGVSQVSQARTPSSSASAQPTAQAAANPPTEAGNKDSTPALSAATAANKSGPPASGVPPNVAEIIRQRMQQGGFQPVQPTAAANTTPESSAPTAELGPLGEASSSDSFLISGTVGRGSNAGDGGFAQFGGMLPMGVFGSPGVPGMEGGGFPGQPVGPPGAGDRVQMIMQMGGIGQPGGPEGRERRGEGRGQNQKGGSGGGGQGKRIEAAGAQSGGFGQGQEGLWGIQRVMRQQVNRIRASFYERYGNSALDARQYSLTGIDRPKIDAWRERFGANFGGPLRLPHVYDGREKTFFFVNYDMARSRDPVDTFATVPLDAERSGDFSARGVEIFDPKSSPDPSVPRTSFGSQIPASRLDPAALGLLRFIPHANLPGLTQNFHLQTRVPTATDSVNARVVHTISPKLNAQVTYNISESRRHSFQSFPDFESNQTSRGQNLMLGLTQNWSKRLINDSRVFWSRNRVQTLNQFAFTNDIAAGLGITGVSSDPRNFGVPQVTLTNFTELNDPVPALRRNQTFRFLDNVSFNRAKHTVRVGGEIRRMQVNTLSDPTPRGLFAFTGSLSGFDFADFLLGLPRSTTERFGSSSTYFRNWGFVGYFQDDWRIHPRFSLNWGLRYEAVTPLIELFDHIVNLDANPNFTAVTPVLAGQPGPFSGPLPRSLVRPDYGNWSPRLAIAWKPPFQWLGKHPMTVRAGYGMFYNTAIYNQLAASMANQPPFAQAQTRVTTSDQPLTLENGFPPVPANTVRNLAAVDPNYRLGYAQMWNFSVETQLTSQTLLETTYTGTKGTHLDLLRAPNRTPQGRPADPNALGFTFDTFGASSVYHALQVRLQRRMHHGLMIQGLYTFGKSIDNASSIGGGTPVVVQDETNFAAERGLSSFDVRHQVRLTYFYELPFGERKRWAQNGWKAALLGRWTLSGNTVITTGTPFTARVLDNGVNNGGVGANFSTRADQIGDPALPGDQRTTMRYFNTDAFKTPLAGRFGDAARNTIPGPGTLTINCALARNISFGKDHRNRLDFRWEASNLTNTANFSGLSTVVGSTTFGRVLSVRAMRTMDFTARVNF